MTDVLNLPPEIQKLMGEMWADINRNSMTREEAAAKADPQAHKLSHVFTNSNYRYYTVRNGRGQQVRYCYSTHRNVAGFFLTWRETIRKNGTGKRDQFSARRKRCAVRELAQRRANRHLPAPPVEANG